MKVSEQQPKPHAKYLVQRDNFFFTATPCYGLHEPWWVVRIMGAKIEAPPELMLPDDEWWPAGGRYLSPSELAQVREALDFAVGCIEGSQRDYVGKLEPMLRAALSLLGGGEE